MSAPLAFLYRRHAWNSGLEGFCAVVILCVVSPCCRLRTTTAMRSVGLKLSRMYSDADGTGGVGFTGAFMAAPVGPARLRRSRTRPDRDCTDSFRPPPTQSLCL